MTSINTIAGTAGRITGITIRTAQELNALIDWREALELSWRCSVVLAVLTWHAGRLTGRSVHRLNDWLAAAWRVLLAGTCKECLQVADHVSKETPFVDHVAPIHAPQPPAIHPLAALAAELEQLTCRELQALTGCRRKASKARLVAMALAG